MAQKRVWLGSVGPYLFDDADIYAIDGAKLKGIRTDSQLLVAEAPTEDTHVMRKQDVESILQTIPVANIHDPSAELNVLEGHAAGSLLMAYKHTADGYDEGTLYVWDTSAGDEHVPYIVDGDGGSWIAIAGRYVNQNVNISGQVTVADLSVGDSCFIGSRVGIGVENAGEQKVLIRDDGRQLVLQTNDGLSSLTIHGDGEGWTFLAEGNNPNLVFNTSGIGNAFVIDDAADSAIFGTASVIVPAPTDPSHAARLADVMGSIESLAVADIHDPSAELASKSGTVGKLLIVYEIGAGVDETTVYMFDTAATLAVPYVVAGSGGFWVAIAGRYVAQNMNLTGQITISDLSVGDSCFVAKKVGIGVVNTGPILEVQGVGNQLTLETPSAASFLAVSGSGNGWTFLSWGGDPDIIFSTEGISNAFVIDDSEDSAVFGTASVVVPAPTDPTHAARLADVISAGVTVVDVANIDDPSSELAGLDDSDGGLIIARQVSADNDLYTFYNWDSAVSYGVVSPYIVAGSNGYWIACGGRYTFSPMEIAGAVTIGGTAVPYTGLLTLTSTTDSDEEAIMRVNRYRGTGVSGDEAFSINVHANDDDGEPVWLSSLNTVMQDATSTNVTSKFRILTRQSGVLADRFACDGNTVRIYGKMAGGSSGAAGSPASNELLWGGRLHVIDTAEQMRLGYDASNYVKQTVSADGAFSVLTEGTDADLTIGTKNNASAIFIDESAGSISLNATHVLLKTANFYQRYDASNYVSFTVGSTGNLAVAPTGTNTTISGTLGVGGTYDDGRLHVLGNNSGDLVVAKLENSSNGGSAITRLLMELGTGGVAANIALGFSSSAYMRFGLSSAGEHMRLTSGGLGIGTGAHPSAKLHVVSTTEQLRVGYDTNNYFKLAVASDGAATLTAQGTDPDFTISTPTASLFMDASGDAITLDASVIYHDALNQYFRYDGSNHLLMQLQSDGAVHLHTGGSDPDMLLTTQNIQYAIYIDNSAGSVGFGTDAPDSSTVAHFNGKVLVGGDLTVTGRVGGAPVVLTASHAASQAVSSITAGLMLLGDVQIGGTSSQGFVAHRSGSIVGISIIYDVTAEGGPLAMFSTVNGTLKSTTGISSTVGTGKKATDTFSRGTYTFSAGDVIQWGIRVISGSPTTVDDVICSLEIIYD